jgi:regulator of extracellular matrix RemA (YlzA/DUF370 family)
MSAVLHVGFYNYVTTESVVALLDYKLQASKRIVKTAKDEKPRSVMDVTKGRKAQTLIVLTGDRYIISAIYRQRLAKRLDPGSTEAIDHSVEDNNATGKTTGSEGKAGEEASSD